MDSLVGGQSLTLDEIRKEIMEDILRRPSFGGTPAATVDHSEGGAPAGKIGKISNFLQKFAEFCKFSAGSFSAVSKRNFARKNAFDSICQALQDLHPFAPLQSQNFRKKSV